jgi:dTMP kinase
VRREASVSSSDVHTPEAPARRGLLFAFEGIDGSGKSSALAALATWLEEREVPVVVSFEPTEGEYGRQLRAGMVEGRRHDRDRELELFRLDRARHVEQLIAPALREGRVVLLDRYYYSSMAYQGSRGGLTPGQIYRMMGAFAPTPDCTFLFLVDVDTALHRITQARGEAPNAFERREDLLRVQQVFEAMDQPEIHRVDASRPPEDVVEQVLARARTLLAHKGLLPGSRSRAPEPP